MCAVLCGAPSVPPFPQSFVTLMGTFNLGNRTTAYLSEASPTKANPPQRAGNIVNSNIFVLDKRCMALCMANVINKMLPSLGCAAPCPTPALVRPLRHYHDIQPQDLGFANHHCGRVLRIAKPAANSIVSTGSKNERATKRSSAPRVRRMPRAQGAIPVLAVV